MKSLGYLKYEKIRSLRFRARTIYCSYHGYEQHSKCSAAVIAKVFGITKSRVYQILKEATSAIEERF